MCESKTYLNKLILNFVLKFYFISMACFICMHLHFDWPMEWMVGNKMRMKEIVFEGRCNIFNILFMISMTKILIILTSVLSEQIFRLLCSLKKNALWKVLVHQNWKYYQWIDSFSTFFNIYWWSPDNINYISGQFVLKLKLEINLEMFSCTRKIKWIVLKVTLVLFSNGGKVREDLKWVYIMKKLIMCITAVAKTVLKLCHLNEVITYAFV